MIHNIFVFKFQIQNYDSKSLERDLFLKNIITHRKFERIRLNYFILQILLACMNINLPYFNMHRRLEYI